MTVIFLQYLAVKSKNHDMTIWDFDGNGGRIFEPFPPFHLAGFLNKIMSPLYTNAVPLFGPPLRPPSGALVAEIMRQQRIRGCLLPPSVAEQLLHEPDGLDMIKGLDSFCYASGPLSPAAGDAISAVTNLCQFYGSTELGQVRQLLPRREDWSFMQFHPHAKLEFQPSEMELLSSSSLQMHRQQTAVHSITTIRDWKCGVLKIYSSHIPPRKTSGVFMDVWMISLFYLAARS